MVDWVSMESLLVSLLNGNWFFQQGRVAVVKPKSQSSGPYLPTDTVTLNTNHKAECVQFPSKDKKSFQQFDTIKYLK